MTNETIHVPNDTPPAEVEREILRKMLLIRLCDERLVTEIRGGRLIAPHYSPRGQEAISSAMSVHLRPDDQVVTIYRGLSDHLSKGVPLRELWSEYAGRTTGPCKGKGGPMHISHAKAGISITTGIVGSGLPIANGIAWASLLKGDGKVVVTNFGDGASNIGAFHEALNMASVWKLPVIFLCHNNGYSEHTRFDLCTAVDNVADRASSYKMAGVTVDGNDPLAVWAAARDAVDRARSGEGPTLLECKTFRFNGHVFGDPGEYIPKDIYAAALEKDPVPAYRASVLARGVVDEAGIAAIETEILAALDDAVEFALSAPIPEDAELARDVYKYEIAL